MTKVHDDCPLCGERQWAEVRRVATGPIDGYWRAIGIDLAKDYPGFPSHLSQRRCFNCGLHFFSPMIVGLPSLYAALSTHNADWYYTPHKWEFTQVLERLAAAPVGRLLEIGCGAGNFLSPASQFCDNATGIESNPDALRECTERGLDVRNCGIADLSERFDVIVSFQVFEHVENPKRFFEDCIERLAPGGRLIVAVPNQDGVLGEFENNFLNLPPHHVTLWRRSCFEYLAEHYDLAIESYLVEPITFDLYASYSNELLDKLRLKGGVFARLYNRLLVLLHRAQLPGQFEKDGRSWPGHTHIAIFRKSPE